MAFSLSLDELGIRRCGPNANDANEANFAKLIRKFAFFVPFVEFALSLFRF